jgi:hypothetical protein
LPEPRKSPPRRLVPQQHSEEQPSGNLRSRFRPLAEARVTSVLKAMDYLGQLSQRTRYHYTDAEWQEMYDAVAAKLAELDAAFRDGHGSRPKFIFSNKDD